jgi:hypothetical protein
MIVLIVVTLVSVVVAIAMSIVAWRLATEERRRSELRVATLASEIHDRLDMFRPEPVAGPSSSAELFTTSQRAGGSGARLATVLAFGVIVAGSVATVGLLLSSRSSANGSSAENRTAAPNGTATARAVAPLELVALGHERAGDQLTVRGVVRNPPSGAAVDGLTAVVFLFGKDGGFITSGRTTVESPRLGPGNESRFVLTVPAAAAVARYRVSFRTDDQIVPHVDRREPPLARSE